MKEATTNPCKFMEALDTDGALTRGAGRFQAREDDLVKKHLFVGPLMVSHVLKHQLFAPLLKVSIVEISLVCTIFEGESPVELSPVS